MTYMAIWVALYYKATVNIILYVSWHSYASISLGSFYPFLLAWKILLIYKLKYEKFTLSNPVGLCG